MSLETNRLPLSWSPSINRTNMVAKGAGFSVGSQVLNDDASLQISATFKGICFYEHRGTVWSLWQGFKFSCFISSLFFIERNIQLKMCIFHGVDCRRIVSYKYHIKIPTFWNINKVEWCIGTKILKETAASIFRVLQGCIPIYMNSYPRRLEFLSTPLWEPQISIVF